MKRFLTLLTTLLLIAACRQTVETPSIRVTIIADGRERTFSDTVSTTVGEFLRNPQVNIELGELDQINPSIFTQITDGLRITIVRVSQRTECEDSEIPYRQRQLLNEGLAPGEQRVGQAGQNGAMQVCYRITSRDGVESERTEISRTELKAPQDEIIYVGPTGEIEPVPITGTIGYLNNGNAWVIRGSSTGKRPITTTGDLDKRVFSLSPDGRKLLVTRKTNTATGENTFNRLYLIPNVSQDGDPIALVPGDVLYAAWIPNTDNTISYSTGEAREAAPGWQAYNDLWRMRIDPQSGEALNVEEIVERSGGGLYGWWGTRFDWSPDGQKLVWVQADSLGLVDLDNNRTGDPLLTFPVFFTRADWSWRATVSWSPDSELLLTTVHGSPVGRELPENSPAFHVAVTDTTGTFSVDVVKNAGIWSAPKYSPLLSDPDSQFPKGYLAYLQARDPFNSINGEYDLVVADRDGSNARTIFPKPEEPGIAAQESIFQNHEFVWSPDGRQIAVIYQGNLWIVDVESGVTHQLTLDGGASNPAWAS